MEDSYGAQNRWQPMQVEQRGILRHGLLVRLHSHWKVPKHLFLLTMFRMFKRPSAAPRLRFGSFDLFLSLQCHDFWWGRDPLSRQKMLVFVEGKWPDLCLKWFHKLPNQKKCSSPSVRNKYSKCIRSIRTGSLILEPNTCTR